MTGFAVFGPRPAFVVQLAKGTDGALIELCRDRYCGDTIERFMASGSPRATGRPANALATGRVFWRAHGVRGAMVGGEISKSWQVEVRASAPSVDGGELAFASPTRDELRAQHPKTSDLRVAGDVDGDGLTDAIGFHCPSTAGCTSPMFGVVFGSLQGAERWDASALFARARGESMTTVSQLGDVNGDGYADVVLSNSKQAWFVPGRPEHLEDSTPVTPHGGIGAGTLQGIDFNGDGFMDYAAVTGTAVGNLRVNVHLGSEKGLTETPSLQLEGGSASECFGDSIAFGDLNGDGIGDIAVGAYCGGPKRRGQVHVYLGGKSPATKATYVIDEPPPEKTSKAMPHFGLRVAIKNGDLYAWSWCYLDDQEKKYCKKHVAYRYRGGAAGLKVDAPEADVTFPE